jgi:hypothetical protein
VVYAVPVPTYTLDVETFGHKKRLFDKSDIVYALTLFVALVPARFIGYRFWTSAGQPRSISWMLVNSSIFASLFAVSMTICQAVRTAWFRRKERQYELAIEGDEMRSKYLVPFFGHMAGRYVRRGQIRTLIERNRGLTVSKYSRVGTFFLGGVWIPKTLPEYEFLKSLAISWKAEAKT